MNKKYWSSIQCLKKFSEWFSIRTILTQADQVTHATRDSLSLLRFWGMGTFIVTSTRTKNQSVRVRNTINSLDTLEGNKLLFESLSCFRAKKRRNNWDKHFYFAPEKHQFADNLTLEWIINCKNKDDSLFTLLGNYYLLQNSQVSFYPR